MAFFELRYYKVKPGKMDGWVKIMEEQIIPFPGFQRHGDLRERPRRD